MVPPMPNTWLGKANANTDVIRTTAIVEAIIADFLLITNVACILVSVQYQTITFCITMLHQTPEVFLSLYPEFCNS